MKIHELEIKLQEEEHQRKLIQDKANQVMKHSFLFLFGYFFILCRHNWQVHFVLNQNFIYTVPFSTAADRFGGQQDPSAVSVTSSVQQTVQREEV